MGERGPVPKRSEERLGHVTKAQKADVRTVVMVGEVVAPSTPTHWHWIAKYWFDGLKESGQAQFYEPSDWAAALYVGEATSKNIKQKRFSAQLFASTWSAMTDLLTTEASRRRVKLEVKRQGEADEEEAPEGVTSIEDYYKEKLG